jgi:HEAT repeat protein
MRLRSITPETAELVNRLHSTWSPWARVRWPRADRVAVLQAIGESGEPGAIPVTLDYLRNEDRDVATAALEALHRLLALVTTHELPHLDNAVRDRGDSPVQPGCWWASMEPSDVSLLAEMGDPATMLGLAAFHTNGYIRQAALEQLDRLRDGRVLPYLLIRLNDWVAPVRATARRAAERRLVPEYATDWVEHLSMVLRLAEHRCSTHSDFLQQVLHLLKEPACRTALRHGLDSHDRAVRRICYGLLSEARGEDKQAVLEQMLFDHDPIIRARAAEQMGRILEAERLHRLLPRLKQDTWVPVRRAAVDLYAERWTEEAGPVMREALLDTAQGIRDAARAYLKRTGEEDFRAFYIEACRSPSPNSLAVAITALGEIGGKDDAAVVAPFLSHLVPKVRRAAVRTLQRLDADTFVDAFVSALGDESVSVSRAALEALRTRGPRLSADVAWDLFSRSPHLHVRKHVLALMQCLGKWQTIPLLVRGAADSEEAVAERARLEIDKWLGRYNRGFARPTHEEIQDLESALTGAASALRSRLLHELRAIARTWS